MRVKGEHAKGIIVVLMFLLLINLVSATDVAYIYKKDYRIDNNILDVFDDLGLSYELINERNLPDFSDYRIIFIGDENLKNADKIPIDKKTSVIVNYYHGDTLGLTDYDGISKLGSTSPLEVRKDGEIIQVYTAARYYIGSEAIAYYYLDNKNKVPEMVRIASTWVGLPGTGFSSQFGDVISYMYPGTELKNGKITEKRVCFFGIVESDYWTPAARQMFEDCIGFVSIVCSKDSDCGEDKEEEYCKNEDVYKDTITYECINPGEEDSYCDEDKKTELIEECYECEDGECEDECKEDSDCDDNLFCNGQETCILGKCESGGQIDCSVFDKPGISGCNTSLDNNPLTLDYSGGFSSYCSENIQGCVIENPEESSECEESCGSECDEDDDCPEKCTQTSHKLYTIEECNECECEYSSYDCVIGECGAVCEVNEDCGCEQDYCDGTTLVDYPEYSSCGTSGSEGCLCSDCVPNLIEDSPQCGYVEEYCGDGIIQQGEDCETNSDCDDYNEETIDSCNNCLCENLPIPPITCSENSDCGNNGCLGFPNYCSGSEVYQDWIYFECINPGTSGSYCSNHTLPLFVRDCGESSCNEWENYCSGNDARKKRTCYDKGCEQGICYNNEEEIDLFVEECYECKDGQCEDECKEDSDCGQDYYSDNYCDEDFYKDFHQFSCTSGNCREETREILIEDCGENSCSEWDYYCDSCREQWKTRICYETGCNNGCYSNEKEEEELAERCSFLCCKGQCINPFEICDLDCSFKC